MTTRRSAINLQRLADPGGDPGAVNSEQSKDTGDLLQRDYTLNMDKTMKKRLNACNAEFKVSTEYKGGGNYVFTFSAAIYELHRDALVQHFECFQNDIDKDTMY